MRFTKSALMAAAVLVVLVSSGAWAAGDGPVADFPSFIPFNINKTGDVAVDKVGNVYVNVTENDGHVKIWKFSPAGEGPFVVADIGMGVAYGLAVEANGNLYASMTGGVYHVDRDGNPSGCRARSRSSGQTPLPLTSAATCMSPSPIPTRAPRLSMTRGVSGASRRGGKRSSGCETASSLE